MLFIYLFVFNSILALGSNTVYELSYVDPATQKTVTCTDMCYLANLPNMTYQDFTVVKNINTTGIRIDINSWIGIGGGLGNVQIFQSGNISINLVSIFLFILSFIYFTTY